MKGNLMRVGNCKKPSDSHFDTYIKKFDKPLSTKILRVFQVESDGILLSVKYSWSTHLNSDMNRWKICV